MQRAFPLVAAGALAADWHENHDARPTLFGQPFHLVDSPSRYGLDPFHALHAWLWRHNPKGMVEDLNPRVHCP